MNNVSNESNSEVPVWKAMTALKISGICAYITVFTVAVVNNLIVLTVIVTQKNMRNSTNLFIGNLAVADLTVAFLVQPFTLFHELLMEWPFGGFTCKLVAYLQGLAVSASVSTLAAVAVERYFAVVLSKGGNQLQGLWAAFVLFLLWTIPAVLNIPWILFFDTQTIGKPSISLTICRPQTNIYFRSYFIGVVLLAFYVLPLLFMCVCYALIGLKVWGRAQGLKISSSAAARNIHRSKIRIVRMLCTVTVVFAISWLPVHIVTLYVTINKSLTKGENRMIREGARPIVRFVSSVNTAVNPFIYCYFSKQFRRGFSKIIGRRFVCLDRGRNDI